VRQSICEALSNVLHPSLKNNFNSIISNITTIDAALVRNIFHDHYTPTIIPSPQKRALKMANYEQGFIPTDKKTYADSTYRRDSILGVPK